MQWKHSHVPELSDDISREPKENRRGNNDSRGILVSKIPIAILNYKDGLKQMNIKETSHNMSRRDNTCGRHTCLLCTLAAATLFGVPGTTYSQLEVTRDHRIRNNS